MRNHKILDAIVVDHLKINSMLDNVRSSSKAKALRTLIKLKAEVERHMAAEENIIFAAYGARAGESQEMVHGLVAQHREMLKALRLMKSHLKNGWKPDFLRFDILWDEHRDLEEESFYPELDRALGLRQRMDVVGKIKAALG